MQIRMLYNNIGTKPGWMAEKGLSVWIEYGSRAVLFDTGGDGGILQNNILQSGFDTGKLVAVVISHHHWDHKNGLEGLLEMTPRKPEVFLAGSDYPPSLLNGTMAPVHRVTEPRQIDASVWTTGPLKGIYRDAEIEEQALVLIRGDSMVLLTGCSHPGIVNVVYAAQKQFPGKRITLAAGGVHMAALAEPGVLEISERLSQAGVETIAPSHCTGEEAIAIFRTSWGRDFIDFNLGDTLTL